MFVRINTIMPGSVSLHDLKQLDRISRYLLLESIDEYVEDYNERQEAMIQRPTDNEDW